MESFISYTISWYKGEAFEALITSVFGFLLIFTALFFWKIASTQGGQSLITPLLIVGLIIGTTGAYNTYSNHTKMKKFQEEQFKITTQFIQSEKERVEGFQYLYTFTKFLAMGLFTSALLIFFFTENKYWQAIAIAMIVLGLSGLIIDYFSKERADIYYEIILNSL